MYSYFPSQNQTYREEEEHLQTQRNIPIPIIVILLEHIRHALQADAGLHKEVETHVVVAATIVRAVQELDELRRKTVPECDEGVCEFVIRDAARAVDVKAVEEVAPRGEEAPEAAVLEGEMRLAGNFFAFKGNRWVMVGVG